jgi:peptidyl-prolyl cis-trans isomerase-like protein 2
VVGGNDSLSRLEAVKTDEGNRPIDDCILEDVVVFVDPFEEFQKERTQNEDAQRAKEEIQRQGGTEDDKTTWTGKRIRGDGKVEDTTPAGVGKYLKTTSSPPVGEDEIVGEWDESEPPKKKAKSGGFGNFDSW